MGNVHTWRLRLLHRLTLLTLHLLQDLPAQVIRLRILPSVTITLVACGAALFAKSPAPVVVLDDTELQPGLLSGAQPAQPGKVPDPLRIHLLYLLRVSDEEHLLFRLVELVPLRTQRLAHSPAQGQDVRRTMLLVLQGHDLLLVLLLHLVEGT